MRLVLASASPARKRVLTDAGIIPVISVSEVDEDAVSARLGPLPPAQLAQELAIAKARDVARHFPSQADVVVGCDSIFELDGQAHGKPLTPEVARARIAAMSGRTGLLHTGHCAIRAGRQATATATTVIHFAELAADDIDAYVATGEPLQVAGSFTLDGLAGAYITGIEGDPSNVVGISLPTTRRLVTELGVRWTDLWGPASGGPGR